MIRRSALVALLAGGVALAAPSVAAASPSCGQNVTHNITLHADLNCTNSDGLDVGKSGVTINLNGHTITETSGCCYYGIYNYHHNNVTVENGTVKDFYYEVYNEYTGGSKVLHVKAKGGYYGIWFEYSLNGLIDRSTMSGHQYGAYLVDNMNVNVTNSRTFGNTYGVFDDYSHATLNHVRATGNTYGFYIEYPIVTGTAKSPAYYTIENSTANNNSNSGFYITSNYGPEFRAYLLDNTANNNTTYGFYAQYRGTKAKGNHATGNGTNCYRVPCS